MKKTIALAMAVLTLFMSGCAGSGGIFSNYRETEHLQLVQALGADTADEGGVTLSVSCAKPAKEASGGIISRSGENLLRAMSRLQDYSADQQLYYAHAQYVLFGEDYAKAGLDTALDFIARDTQLRLGLCLFVVREGTAKELITGPGEESYEISKTLTSIRRDTETEGMSHVFTARETLRSLSEHGAALLCALRKAETEGSVFLLEPGLTAVPDGYGIIKDGFLVGYVDTDISQAANLMLGHLGSAGVSLPDGRGGKLNLEYDSGKARVSADGGVISVEAKLKANLAEPDTDIMNVTDTELMSQMEQRLARDMEQKIQKLLELSRELDADFLGLGAYLPEKSENWLKNAEFSVKCTAEINYTRELGDSVSTEGGAS